MAIARSDDLRPLAIGERLRALLARHAKGAESAQLATFTQLLLRRGAGYLEGLAEEEAAALVLSAFRFFGAPGPDLRVRACTPTYVTEGWDAQVSVIETCMPDRPFIVDTIRETLRAAGIEIRALLHPILAVRRDATGCLEEVAVPTGEAARESFVHAAIPRTGAETLAKLADEIRARLEDVRLVSDDFPAMLARTHALASELERLGRTRLPQVSADATAAADFLRWLVDGGFVFLGYREYALEGSDAERTVCVRAGTGLGLLRRESRSAVAEPTPLASLPEAVRVRLLGPRLLTVTTTTAPAPVHRSTPMTDVGVAELDAEGRVVGMRRLIGLFTSKALAEEAAEVPLLRRVLRQVLAAEQVVPGSHDHKEIVAIFNALPKGELFASTPEDVRDDIRTAMAAARTDAATVTVRRRGRRLSVLAILPTLRFSGAVVTRIRSFLTERFGGTLLEEDVHAGDDGYTRLHLAFAVPPELTDPDVEDLRDAIADRCRTWEELLGDALVDWYGASEGRALAARYTRAFPESYKAAVGPEQALGDVTLLQAALVEGTPRIVLRAADGRSDATLLRLYLAGAPLVLADFVPLLEHLGLRALGQDEIALAGHGPALTIQSFLVQDRCGRALDVDAVGPRLIDALLAVRAGRTDSDVLGRLVVEAGLDWRAVACLRTYAGYAVQAGLGPRPAVLAALAEHPASAAALFACFAARFGSGPIPVDPKPVFTTSLDAVQSLRQDTLLRALLELVEATVRTNFYVPDPPPRLAIKLRSGDLKFLPSPRPLYEIFVHAPGMEGVHLRAGRIARGGIRASDRPDDFRTEVLGLMKTQTVKNAVIVPTGAKGGFVLRGVPPTPDAVRAAYETFIRGLLDLTDDVVDGRVVHPRGLVIHDEEDPYLVVAADKGTARFSDVANGIAAEYGFWLGDAFASGGSQGYDHKALGITARGAWESVRQHCRELGLDADTAPLTVAGIGDMGGDVFGNGLLRSPHVVLRAAFNHQHVFLDPEPDPARSFAERERLYRAVAGWDAYDRAVLSPGGVIAPRAAKRVELTPEARRLLGVADDARLSGEAVVQAILALDADLLWNGGIGTYVKAPGESDADVGDTTNDPVRVDAGRLRVRIVAEGGNLGFTQRARIAYALAGGRINTDAVDNSAGVDMSDHEVNLKICLQPVVASGALDATTRNALLVDVGPEVADRVLAHNRSQNRLLGVDQIRSRTRLEDFRAVMAELERSAGLDRVLAGLPDRETLRDRRATFLGLTRPELAVLTAFTKIRLRDELLASSLPDDPLLEPILVSYFPAAVAARFPDAVRTHRLRREIIAAELVNALVDDMGTTFVQRVARDTGATAAQVMWAWVVGWAIADGARLAGALAAARLAADVAATCRLALERVGDGVTRWVLANVDPAKAATLAAEELATAVAAVAPRLPAWITGPEAEAFQHRVSALEIGGVASDLARDLTTGEWLPGLLDVVRLAQAHGLEPADVGPRYYGLGQQLDFVWLIDRLGEAADEDRWQRRAAAGLVEDLYRARRDLSLVASDRIPARALETIYALVRDLRATQRVTLAALQVVVRELRRLAESTVREEPH